MLRKSFPMQIVNFQKAPKWCLNCGLECENWNEEFCTDCLEVIHTSFQDKIRYAAKSHPTDCVVWDDFDNAMTHVYNDQGPLKPIEIEGPLFTSPTDVPIFHEIRPYSRQTCLIPNSREQRKENQKPVLNVFLKRGPGIYPIVVPLPNGSLAIGSGNIDKTVKVCRVRPWIQSEYRSSEETVKRGRGRPRIHPLTTEEGCASIEVKRGRGRPRIHPVVEAIANAEFSDESGSEQVKRGRGRPRIHPIAPPRGDVELEVELNPENLKRGRGRPRKYAKCEDEWSDNEECPKRGRGRPRKYPRYEEADIPVASTES